ncbi:MAG: hypothetical protein F2667_05670 [Actinobacteria bacterium]|uniref:Unannotated protein n=1 Tax=freshwater metagenome TaxID=449393 RepID=A0A6J6Q4P3_9ZZZZ|nr:hypothetical protein [Actinomycetota bacterium]
MKLPSLRKPSPSLVVSVLALVVASTGTSYAAGLIGGEDIRNGSITSEDVKNRSLLSNDFKRGELPAGEAGPVGPVGPAGETGPVGPAGAGRWVLIAADGTIEAQSGGFTLVAAYPTLPNTAVAPADNSLRAAGNVYLNANEDLSDNGVFATIALQNTVDQNADTITNGRATAADANPEFSGEISVSRCNVGAPTTPASGPTNCAPSGAQNATSFVVSPRNSDGTVTTTTTHKRFYVIITGDSSDFVAPTV